MIKLLNALKQLKARKKKRLTKKPAKHQTKGGFITALIFIIVMVDGNSNYFLLSKLYK